MMDDSVVGAAASACCCVLLSELVALRSACKLQNIRRHQHISNSVTNTVCSSLEGGHCAFLMVACI
jgi:hypothetical protein